MPLLRSEILVPAIAAIFVARRVPAETAQIVAEHLVDADACGVSSHGVIRVPQYLQALDEGRVNAEARLVIQSDHLSTVRLDGGNGFGQVMAKGAMEMAIERARRAGVSAVTLVNVGHTGRLGSYTELAARRGMAAMMFNNTGGCGQWVAPFGGAAGRLATNPVSMAVPSESGDPLMLDIATSIAPEGRVRSMLTAGKPIPDGWVIDHRGQPTNDPAALYGPPRGSLLPFGGHKGFGLSMLVDALAGGLSGAGCCTDADTPMAGKTDGVLMIAIDIAAFCPPDDFANTVARQMKHVKSALPAPGAGDVLVPGELEGVTRRQRLRDGIPVEPGTWKLIQKAAASLNVPLPAG